MRYLSGSVVFRLCVILAVIDIVNACVLTHLHLSEAKRLALIWKDFCQRTLTNEPTLMATGSSLDKICKAKTQWVEWSRNPVLMFLLALLQHLMIGKLYYTISGTDVFAGGALSGAGAAGITTYAEFTFTRLLNLAIDEYMRWTMLVQCSLLGFGLWWVYYRYRYVQREPIRDTYYSKFGDSQPFYLSTKRYAQKKV
jgi:hypothetical protein